MFPGADLILGPAYGRDYKSLAAAKADWEADKDFRVLPGGPVTNRSDLEGLRGTQFLATNAKVWVRFNGLTEKKRLA